MEAAGGVSIVVTVLNEAGSIARLLDALLVQSASFDEIVVVDGGSRDSTVAILELYTARDPRLKVFVEPGANISRGRNIAIKKARGEIIAVIDGGCIPHVDWLTELLPAFADPAVGAVGGGFEPVANNRFEFYSGRMSLADPTAAEQQGMFYGRSSAFRRSVWQRAGGYPEWLYTAEDTLFALRVRAMPGVHVRYATHSLVQWWPRPTLYKMAKMFYLYGRGNGRIGNGSVGGTLYWLRQYMLLLAGATAGIVWPPALLLAVLGSWPLWRGVVAPNLQRMRGVAGAGADRWRYVPAIALVRNAATNLGYLRGWLEYRRQPEFREKYEAYVRESGT